MIHFLQKYLDYIEYKFFLEIKYQLNRSQYLLNLIEKPHFSLKFSPNL